MSSNSKKENALERVDTNKLISSENSFDSLDPEIKKRINALASSLDITDTNAVIQFGLEAHNKLSSFSDGLIEKVKMRDTGPTEELLYELIGKLKDVDPSTLLEKKSNFFERLPFVDAISKRTQKFLSKYQTVAEALEKITSPLMQARLELFKDIEDCKAMKQCVLEYSSDLDEYIYASKLLISKWREKVEEMKTCVDPNNIVENQEITNIENALDRMERKAFDFITVRTVALQELPKIQLMENADAIIIEKIQTSMQISIPLWKEQFSAAIMLVRQGNSVKLLQEFTDTTNALLLANSKMLKQSTIETANALEKPVVDVDTLKTCQKDLIETFEEIVRIFNNAKKEREIAEAELASMQTKSLQLFSNTQNSKISSSSDKKKLNSKN